MTNSRHEHRGPVFSVSCSHGQEPAASLPQEHLAWAAQTQPSLETPQQVEGRVMMCGVWTSAGQSRGYCNQLGSSNSSTHNTMSDGAQSKTA